MLSIVHWFSITCLFIKAFSSFGYFGMTKTKIGVPGKKLKYIREPKAELFSIADLLWLRTKIYLKIIVKRIWNMEHLELQNFYVKLLNQNYRWHVKFLKISKFRLNTITFRSLISTTLDLKKIFYLKIVDIIVILIVSLRPQFTLLISKSSH